MAERQDELDRARRLSRDALIAGVEDIRVIVQQEVSFDNQVLETSYYKYILELVTQQEEKNICQVLDDSDENLTYLREVRQFAEGEVSRLRASTVSKNREYFESFATISRHGSTNSLNTDRTGAVRRTTRSTTSQGVIEPLDLAGVQAPNAS